MRSGIINETSKITDVVGVLTRTTHLRLYPRFRHLTRCEY